MRITPPGRSALEPVSSLRLGLAQVKNSPYHGRLVDHGARRVRFVKNGLAKNIDLVVECLQRDMP